MKRIVYEWGLIASIGTFLALSTLFGTSLLVDQAVGHFKISTTGDVWHDIHLLAGDGDLWFFNQFETDSSGQVRPLIVDLRMRTRLAPKDYRIGRYKLPGFDMEYCRFSAFDNVAWSLRLSLFYPVVLSLLVAALFHRLGRAESRRKVPPIPEGVRP